MAKIGRNDLCPCGSGKKYKHCCLGKEQAEEKKNKKLDETNDNAIYYQKKAMEEDLLELIGKETSKAQEIAFDGWEFMASGQINEAKKCFEKALRLDPDLGDAYNGLAEVALYKNKIAEAEKYYKTAYEKAKANLGTEDIKAFVWWGELSTRPYMRARYGLGMVYLMTRRYEEAIKEFKEILARNPNDNQGIRYLIAPAYLLNKDLPGALREFEWYKKHYKNDWPTPDFQLNWALALFLAKRYEESAARFRSTIFLNPYLIKILVGEELKKLPIWHFTNLMELDYALEYFDLYAELWIGKEEAFRFIRFLWEDEEIQQDYQEWVRLGTLINGLKDYDKRVELCRLIEKIEKKKLSPRLIQKIKQFVQDSGWNPS